MDNKQLKDATVEDLLTYALTKVGSVEELKTLIDKSFVDTENYNDTEFKTPSPAEPQKKIKEKRESWIQMD